MDEDDDFLMEVEEDENRIVLHEDKKYYPDTEEVYPGVKTVLLDEDAQDLNEPIIKPIKPKVYSIVEKELPELNYTSEFLTALLNSPNLVRNIAFIGHLHHGKTLFTDIMVQAAQSKEWDPSIETRFTDLRKDEQERKISLKSSLVSLVLEDLKSKSYLFNIIDCPGHVNFEDESIASLRAVDGAVVIVDAVEGVMLSTERLIKQAVQLEIPLCLVINKMDRLILELKLPPQDAFFKLMHTLEEVNRVISESTVNGRVPQRLSPELGNVCFGSGQHGWCFTLLSFAQMYCDKHPDFPIDPVALSKRLWGDWFVNERTCAITKKKPSGSSVRTFVQYILEPLYKIYSSIVGETPDDLRVIFKQLGIRLKNREFHLDPRPLMKLALSRFFGRPNGFTSMIVNHIPTPIVGAQRQVSLFYSGFQTSDIAQNLRKCDPAGSLVIHVTKLFSSPDGSKFYSMARIYSGKVSLGQRVKVLGESYTSEDDEDMAIAEVTGISVSMGRHFIEVNSAIAGNIVLLEGVDFSIKKSATIISMDMEDAYIFRPLEFESNAVVKLAVEPFIPAELPKMVEALRKINKTYPMVSTKVEESGEHVIIGTGELYMDCIMHDLRHLYSDIEVKVADPVVSFCETVVESSSINCFAETPNKKNKFTMIAEPLDEGLAFDIEKKNVCIDWDNKKIGDFFKSKYDWDLLSARSIWAFGSNDSDPNILMNNTLPSVVDQSLLSSVKDSLVQGFKWGCREGPLCDEPIRNVKFKILDASVASEPIHRGGGQIIPTSRRTVYSSFLLAVPRIMEPVNLVEIQAPADCIQAVYPVLARRRGHIVQDIPKPGTPFYTVKAFIPVMDSFGFETDLRSYTLGQAFCLQVFDHWAVVPGDPLDKNIILHPLEPSPPLALARDFMVKTRRRKGLSEDVSINKYFDEAMMLEIAKHEANLEQSLIK